MINLQNLKKTYHSDHPVLALRGVAEQAHRFVKLKDGLVLN
jgi:hypothetical protein